MLPFAFTLLILTLFVPGGAPAGGWTMYPPLVLQTGDAFPMLIFAVHLMGASSILARDQRHRDDHEHARAGHDAAASMPLFVWTWLITAYCCCSRCRCSRAR